MSKKDAKHEKNAKFILHSIYSLHVIRMKKVSVSSAWCDRPSIIIMISSMLREKDNTNKNRDSSSAMGIPLRVV